MGDPITFAFSDEEAAKISICSTIHMQLFQTQLNFLKQEIEKMQKDLHNDGSKSDSSIGNDLKMLIGNREATSFECVLSALLDHSGVLSLPSALHDFILLMLRTRTLEERSLCLFVLGHHSTNTCLEEFCVTGGLRVLNMWISEYLKRGQFSNIKEIILLLCGVPFNSKTMSYIKESKVPNVVKKLSKNPEFKDESTQLMVVWGKANQSLQEQAVSSSSSQQVVVKREPPSYFDDVKEMISDARATFCAQRAAELERIERERQEEKERYKALRLLQAKNSLNKSDASTVLMGTSLNGNTAERQHTLSSSGRAIIRTHTAVVTTSSAQASMETADIQNSEASPTARKLVPSKKTITLQARAAELRAAELKKKTVGKSVLKKPTTEPVAKKQRRGIVWGDETQGGDLMKEKEYELEHDYGFIRTTAADKASREFVRKRRTEYDDHVAYFQSIFRRDNIMSSFKLKKNKCKYGRAPNDIMKEAIEKKMTMADFEMSISVKSAERIRQDQRQSTVQEARYNKAIPIPQDPATFMDRKGKPVSTSHTGSNTKHSYFKVDEDGNEIAVTRQDIAAGANDRIEYDLDEEKTTPIVMSFVAEKEQEKSSWAGAHTEVFKSVLDERLSDAAMDIDGLYDNEVQIIEEEKTVEDFDEQGLPPSILKLGNEMLQYLVRNEDKFERICIDDSRVDETIADVLGATIRVYRNACKKPNEYLTLEETEMIYNATVDKMSNSGAGEVYGLLENAAMSSTGNTTRPVKSEAPPPSWVALMDVIKKGNERQRELEIAANSSSKAQSQSRKNEARPPSPPPSKKKKSSMLSKKASSNGVCMYYNTFRGCRNGDRCPFVHLAGK